MGDEVMLALVVAESEGAVVPGETLKERLTAAMRKAQGHWMVLDKDTQFRGAIGAVLKTATEEEKAEILKELEGLRMISALISGVPVDLESLEDKGPNVGLLGLWRATQA